MSSIPGGKSVKQRSLAETRDIADVVVAYFLSAS